MKQVKFGSFPLAEIRKEERICLDKYLLKHFSDNISFSDTIINLSVSKDTFYISPQTIVRQMTANSGSSRTAPMSSGSGNFFVANQGVKNAESYNMVVKNAFGILKKFYYNLSKSPFYKDIVYFPIYIEKHERMIGEELNTQHSSTVANGTTTNVFNTSNSDKGLKNQNRFNFLILTNDLLDNQEIARMQVDESIVTNVLFIYIQLFQCQTLFNNKGRLYHQGITSLTHKDLSLIMKLYKYLQKFDINPISLFHSIYKMIVEVMNTARDNSSGSRANFERNINNISTKNENFDSPHFLNMKKSIVDEVKILIINAARTSEPIVAGNLILRIVETILDKKEISDFIINLNNGSKFMNQRMQLAGDLQHYHSIIKVFEELVKFNELSIRDVIVDTDINFGKDLVLEKSEFDKNTETVRKLTGVLDRELFDRSYKAFLNMTTDNFIQDTHEIIRSHVNRDNRSNISSTYPRNFAIETYQNDLNATKESIRLLNVELNSLEEKLFRARRDGDASEITRLTPEITTTQTNMAAAETTADRTTVSLRIELDQRRKFIANQFNDTPTVTDARPEHIHDIIMDAYGFLYKEFDNIFMNPLILSSFFRGTPSNNPIHLDNMSGISQNQFTKWLGNILNTHTVNNNELDNEIYQIARNAFVGVDNTLTYLIDLMVNYMSDLLHENGHTGSNLNITMSDNTKERLTKALRSRITKNLDRYFLEPLRLHLTKVSINEKDGLAYMSSLNAMHPMLGKMARNINNFKSLILSSTSLETLYDLMFVSQEYLFRAGLINRPPMKLSTPEAKIEYVMNNGLGLKNNPVWVTGNQKVRLYLPDYLSLTGQPLKSFIKASELKTICRLDYAKWWKETHINSDPTKSIESDSKVAKIQEDIKKLTSKTTRTDAENLELKRKRYDLEKARKDVELTGLHNIGVTFNSGKEEDFKTRFMDIDLLLKKLTPQRDRNGEVLPEGQDAPIDLNDVNDQQNQQPMYPGNGQQPNGYPNQYPMYPGNGQQPNGYPNQYPMYPGNGQQPFFGQQQQQPNAYRTT